MSKRQQEYTVSPKSENQKQYVKALDDRRIKYVAATGFAGTGKSLLAAQRAGQGLVKGHFHKIVLCRSVTPIKGESLGYLKGDMNQKLEGWLCPITEHLKKFIPNYSKRVESGDIEFVSLAQIRGRSFDNCIVIAEEAQNMSFDILKCLLTRMGSKSKLLMNGDVNQSDVRHNDFYDVCEALTPLHSFKWIELGKEDIFRSDDIAEILELLEPLE